jgi:cytoskeletal protein CcmA (bactofilin family)
MGETGRIEGIVHTRDAVIMGVVDGELYVEGNLHIKGAGKVTGIIQAKLMTVDEGARYVGECKVGV